MKVLHGVHPDDFKRYDTGQIRDRFLIEDMVRYGEINCVYTHYDRMIVGAANPAGSTLSLPSYPNLRADYFLERREMGIINIGGDGTIVVDGEHFNLSRLDCLYIGKGAREIAVQSKSSTDTAIFYILSTPAHAVYPTTFMSIDEADKVEAGSASLANERTIHKYIHANGIKSCQLVMGLTTLKPGSVWNTMPPHVHDRRMEAYFYFDLAVGQRIMHFMGQSNETRHLVMKNHDAVISPPWSIHSGAGTSNYSFIWGMGGENLDYTDMDVISIGEIK